MNKDKPRLGRGLAALLGGVGEPIGVSENVADKPGSVKTMDIAHHTPGEAGHSHGPATLARLIPVNRIDPNPYQPRIQLDPQALAELADSIRQHGIVQPIVVRPHGQQYELVAGQRRLEAAKQVEIAAVPAIVREATDQQMLEIALIENIHREDLNCVDRARAYQTYQETFSLTAEHIAERLGQDRTTVTNYLRLLSLPGPVLDMLKTDKLTMGHARAIAGIENPDEQVKLAEKIVQTSLSVRQTEKLVARIKAGGSAVRVHPKSPNILDLEQQMTRSLSTKVQIIPSRKKGTGKVVIDFYSLDDFDRIIDCICGSQREDL